MTYQFWLGTDESKPGERYTCDECGEKQEHDVMWHMPIGWRALDDLVTPKQHICSSACGLALLKKHHETEQANQGRGL